MPGVGPAVPQQCPETGANFLMGGPFWADPIHNMDWVNGILESVKVCDLASAVPSCRSSKQCLVELKHKCGFLKDSFGLSMPNQTGPEERLIRTEYPAD